MATIGSTIILHSPEDVKQYVVMGEKRTSKATKQLQENGMWRTYINKHRVTFYVEPFNN